MTQSATIVAPNASGLPNSQDWLTIGTDPMPGKWTLLSGNSPRTWDERQGYAQSGATLVPAGDHLGVHVFRVELWTGDQYASWLQLAAKYLAKSVRFVPGTITPRALGVFHPQISNPPQSVTEVVVEDVTDLIYDEGRDTYTCEVHFKEYRAPQPAPQKPDAAIPAAQQEAPTAQDAADAEMQDKLAQFNALAGAPPAGP